MSSSPRGNKAAALTQQAILWISLMAMFGLFVTLFSTDFKVPQKIVTLPVDIKNKINICLPEASKEIIEESLF